MLLDEERRMKEGEDYEGTWKDCPLSAWTRGLGETKEESSHFGEIAVHDFEKGRKNVKSKGETP